MADPGQRGHNFGESGRSRSRQRGTYVHQGNKGVLKIKLKKQKGVDSKLN